MAHRALVLFLLPLSACLASADPQGIAPPPDGPDDPPALSYAKDIKPIVDAHCVGCHQQGGAGPFSLTTLEDVRLAAPAVKAAVVSRRMPPWLAMPGCNDYVPDRSLSEAQIATITQWVDLGAPELPTPIAGAPLDAQTESLQRIDRTVSMRTAHLAVAPPGEYDEHHCFLIDWPETRDRYITAFEARPGNPKVVHHFVGHIVPADKVAELEAQDALTPTEDGWPCGAGSGMTGAIAGGGSGGGTQFDRRQGGGLFAAWVPGGAATRFPEGSGLLIRAGSKLLLNMHYNVLSGSTEPDQTELDFELADTVARPGVAAFFANPTWPIGNGMLIPAGSASVSHSFEYDLTQLDRNNPLLVHAIGMHMHKLAAMAKLDVLRADGSDTCLVDIQHWNFDWQLRYGLQAPVLMQSGDKLRVSCSYDNSAAHQISIDGVVQPPRDVKWGEDTFDEMCLGMLYLTRP